MKLALAVLTFGLIQAATSDPDGTDPLAGILAEARASVDAGQPEVAIEKLKTLDQSEDPRVGHLLGVAHYHTDEYLRAIELLSTVVERLPEGSRERREAVQVLGLCQYLAGRFPESIPLLERTRTWAPDNIELSQVLGMVYIQTRQPDKAREAWAHVFGVAPDSAAAHLLTAQMMVRVEFEEYAESELKRAIEKDPRIPHAHYLLGQMAIFRARYEEGVALTQRELEVNPGNAMAFYQLGDAYSRQQKWDEAVEALQQSLWLNPYYSGPYILLGRAYMKKKQPATAEGMLRRAIEYDPNNMQAHYLLGQLLQQTGRSEEAKREFEIAERLRASEL